MKKTLVYFILPLFLFPLHNIKAFDMNISEKQLETYLRGEYNRNFNFFGDVSLIGAIELNNIFLLRSGISFGGKAGNIDLNSFATASVSPFAGMPLIFSLSWIYNGLFAYDTHSNTILPAVSFNARKAGASIGMNFRFTSFNKESISFQSLLSYSLYFNLINNQKILLSLIWGNLDDFYARNVGAYSFNILVSVRTNKNWQIINEIEMLQSGGSGLAANFYGLAWKGGVKFSW